MYKRKWYLKTWIIAALFALWIVYFIPPIIGIILLVKKRKEDKAIDAERQQLVDEAEKYKNMLSPEMQNAIDLERITRELENNKAELELTIASLNSDISAKNIELEKKKQDLIFVDDEIVVQQFGLYTPQFDFANALDYKEELAKVRALQKELIKNDEAVSGADFWEVNGSKTKGKKMVSDTKKLLLRAFNTECDSIVSKVRYTNFDASLERIYKSSETISKLGTVMNIFITQKYLDAKVKELRLAFEYQQKKEQEKEEAKAARAEQKEQAKVQRELEEQMKKVEKEQSHYQSAYQKLMTQLTNNPDDSDLLQKKDELEKHLSDIDKSIADLDYRRANMKAGYVYIISNIGSFGEGVYKIGMTRRLEPQERIDELGDASVPFGFDVHALIFSDDAPALEAALHRAFADKKVNMVNQRREFFRVSLDEIKQVVKENYDKTVEFYDVPDAEQYRVSEKMRSVAS